MFAFVDHAEAIGLLDKWFLVAVRQQPAMRNGQKTKGSEKIEISGNLAIFPSRFTVHGSHGNARVLVDSSRTRLERGWSEKRFYHHAQYTRGVEMGGLVNVSRRVES